MPGINENSTPEEVREAARSLELDNDLTLIDFDAPVSRSADGGWYVQAWVWVYDTDD